MWPYQNLEEIQSLRTTLTYALLTVPVHPQKIAIYELVDVKDIHETWMPGPVR